MDINLIICLLVAFVFSLVFIPVIIKLCKKFSIYDQVDERKVHSGNVSRFGGLGVFLSFLIAVLLYFLFFCRGGGRTDMIYFFIAAFVIFLEGILDDFFNLPAYVKLVLQIVGALIITFSPLYVKEFVGFTFPEIVGRILTFLWILYIVNAFNLIDGLDLLCSGISFLSLLTIGLYMLNKDSNIAALCFLTCASLFGFLIFNRPPARIFLGDSGSQTLGFFVATIPLMCDFGSYESVKPVAMLLLVSIPAIDVIAAIWRRKRDHHRIFSPDRAHIHHKLINIGFSKTTASYLLIGFQLFICIIVYVSLLLPETSCLVMLSVTLIFVIIFFCVIHFINRAVNIKMNKKLEEIKKNSN